MKSNSNSLENIVFSVLSAPVKLAAVVMALRAEFPDANVYIYRSGYNGAKTIHLHSDDAELEGYPDSTEGTGENSDYLFNGAIDGDSDAVVAKVQSIFTRLTDAGMTVQYEVYAPASNTLIEQKPTQR